MKNLLFLSLILAIQLAAVNELNAAMVIKEDTLKNDLVLVKPLINFNEPNGGYYSDYIDVELNSFFCGAVVQNCGVSSTTDFYLEFSLLTYDNQVIDSYQVAYKDTLPPGITDTLNFPEAIIFDYWNPWNFRFLVFTIKEHLIDSNTANNTDTIPFQLWSLMWSNTSRANNSTNTVDLTSIKNFKSGDFMGITVKIPNSGHQMGALGLYLTDKWPENSSLNSVIYQNGKILYSKPIDISYSDHSGWFFTEYSYWGLSNIVRDSLYYVGVELSYPEGTTIPIGIDTSSFHNFEVETIARIGDTWTTLPFVPLITLVCDPEGIESKQNVNRINIYPNPTQGMLYLENVLNTSIELYDLSGKLLMKQTSLADKKSLDLSNFNNGNYLVKIITDEEVATKIVSILK